MAEGLWIVNDKGESEWLSYEDLDDELIPQLLRPVGGFCYSASVFKRINLPSVPFYVKNWLPKPGKMILYGEAKAGKSYLALQLARCIGNGEDFLGLPTTQGRVLYLQFELGASVLQQRVIASGKEYPDVFLGTTFSMKLDTNSGMEQIKRALDAVSPNVLILDPLYKVMSGDENESHDVKMVTDNLDLLIEAFDCSIIVIHHSGKDLDRGSRGSSTLADYPDSSIAMTRNKEGVIKLIPKLLRHAELPPEPIKAVMEGFEFVVKDSPTVKELVLAYLQDRPKPYSAVGIMELNNVVLASKRAIYNALVQLKEEGLVAQPARGVYVYHHDLTTDPLDVV